MVLKMGAMGMSWGWGVGWGAEVLLLLGAVFRSPEHWLWCQNLSLCATNSELRVWLSKTGSPYFHRGQRVSQSQS